MWRSLASSYHQAEVTWDEGTGKEDLIGTTFGTLELFSRFKLEDTIVYSQYNVLLFLRHQDLEGISPVPMVQMPEDLPVFLFPPPRSNDMPFRGTQDRLAG
jgi:hypothetical protein